MHRKWLGDVEENKLMKGTLFYGRRKEFMNKNDSF